MKKTVRGKVYDTDLMTVVKKSRTALSVTRRAMKRLSIRLTTAVIFFILSAGNNRLTKKKNLCRSQRPGSKRGRKKTPERQKKTFAYAKAFFFTLRNIPGSPKKSQRLAPPPQKPISSPSRSVSQGVE